MGFSRLCGKPALLVEDSRVLLHRTGSTLKHVYREANQCTDHLVRVGAEQEEELVICKESLQSVRILVR